MFNVFEILKFSFSAFWLKFRSLSCLESCGRLLGSISTKFRPYTSDWFRVMTKKLKKLKNGKKYLHLSVKTKIARDLRTGPL